MTDKTRAELVNRALAKLLVLGAGQSADAEDQELVDGVVESVLEDLSARQIISIADPDAIPVAPFEWLATCLAQAVATDFGRAIDYQSLMFAEKMLRQQAASIDTNNPTTTEFF